MIDKTIGVIPPRNELSSFSDKKTENFQDHKSEFESLMTRKQDKDTRQALGGTKKKVQDEDISERRSDPKSEMKMTRKSEKPEKEDKEENVTEGAKKKTKNKLEDTEMILMGMVSPESVIKIPDTEENLDGLEKTNLVNVLNSQSSEVSAEMAMSQVLNATPVIEQAAPVQDEFAAMMAEESALSAMNTPEMLEANPLATQDVPQPEIKGAPAVIDNKVLETLNREQLFQKLDAMAQPEVMTTPPVEAAALAPEMKVDVASEDSLETSMKDIMKNMKSEHHAFSEKNQTVAVTGPASSEKSENMFEQDDQAKMSEKGETSAPLTSSTHHSKEFSRTFTELQGVSQPANVNKTYEPNVKEILNQAQYLVTQGGGEVSVKMSPEGMGEVHLKVMLENGKMSVEMNTHDKAVQKMIQDSLSDLKSSLAAHQISVEHVTLNNKLSSVEAMQKSSDMQNSNDARNFSEGFANNSQNSRERDQRQQAGRVFNYEAERSVPVAKAEINKAAAHRVYQSNKAQGLNAVA